MEIAEHFYTDDPRVGHPDVRTRLSETDYFFLGNGHILAAVQICHSGEGTPLGLLILDPERFGPKRAALSCDPDSGLEGTVVAVEVGGVIHRPRSGDIRGEWESEAMIPTVMATWTAGEIRVQERFSCPHPTRPRIVREVRVEGSELASGPVALRVGPPSSHAWPLCVEGGGEGGATLIHEIRGAGGELVVESRWEDGDSISVDPSRGRESARAQDTCASFWQTLTRIRTSHDGLNRLFDAARSQLPAAVDHRGRMDGSIWQYNLEWVRDQSHVAEAFARLGDWGKARTMLARLLDELVSPEGDTVDSGRRRPAAEVELDQNGELLSALATYLDWTGDGELVDGRWERVRALASFPLQNRFVHASSGLLHNSRCYWERHGRHGIRDGFELMSQFAVAVGLGAAAGMARALGHEEDGERWARAGEALKRAMLEHPRYRLVEENRLIKRRRLDSTWQRSIQADPDLGLPPGIPLLDEGPHLLDPDTSSVLPIAHEFIPPKGDLARNTLARVEELWNQRWGGGGYGRYHASGEPDSPGAWPFASLFVARAYVEAGEDQRVWRILDWLLRTKGGRAGSWFENDGPRPTPPYPQVGIVPWTWAELITLVVHHLLGVRPDQGGITLRPRLLEGVEEMDATFRVRSHRLHLVARKAPSPEARGGVANGEPVPWDGCGVRVPLPTSDLRVVVFC